MRTRSFRRYRRKVLIDRWRHRLRSGYGSAVYLIPDDEWVERHARRRARTARICSCFLCSCNRKLGILSSHEIKANIGFKEQVDEVFLGKLW